jgi:glycosyltransferase involved in cell wall biosynthesis
MPRFSVVVPTRDRPDLLEFCLASLAEQTYRDVEVIVSDNPVHEPAREVFDRFAGPGWRYVRPEQPIAMHDNFELGCDAASGDYVAVLIDKTVLHPSALAFAAHVLEHERDIDLLTWWNEGYDPLDETGDVRPGRFLPVATVVAPQRYDTRREVARRFLNSERRGSDPVHYFRGKIVFGAYSGRLLDRIRAHTERVFHPVAPDYTSMVPGLVFAESALDLGRPLLVSYNSSRSNGRQQSLDPAYARRFIEMIDPAILDALPISRLYTSHHNVVAYDLVSSAERCPSGSTPELDLPNLVRRAREDLAAVVWTDEEVRAEQYAILEAAEANLGVAPAITPPVTSLLQRVGAFLPARRAPEPVPYPSPLDAARAADQHYARASS